MPAGHLSFCRLRPRLVSSRSSRSREAQGGPEGQADQGKPTSWDGLLSEVGLAVPQRSSHQTSQSSKCRDEEHGSERYDHRGRLF